MTELSDLPASARERRQATGFGGAEGNELLTTRRRRAVLTILLLAEGVTILHPRRPAGAPTCSSGRC